MTPDDTSPPALEDVVVSLNAQGEVIHIDLRDQRYSDFRVPFTPAQVEQGLDDYGPGRAASDPLVMFGATLFGTVFAGERGRALWELLDQVTRANRALRLRIRTNLERTQHLPWELLYDASRGDFVALSGRVALVRTRPDDFHVPRQLPPLQGLRLLLVTADAEGDGQAAAQADAFEQGLAEAGTERIGVQRLVQPTRAALQAALRAGRFDAFVFMGTGVLQKELSKAGGLRQDLQLLPDGADDDGRLGRNKLGQWLRDAGVRLAVVIGSHSDWIARSWAKQVPATLGCRGELRPETRLAMAGLLGRLLPTGQPLDLAVTALRQGIDRALPGTGEWCRLIFYLQALDGAILLGPPAVGRAAEPPMTAGAEAPEEAGEALAPAVPPPALPAAAAPGSARPQAVGDAESLQPPPSPLPPAPPAPPAPAIAAAPAAPAAAAPAAFTPAPAATGAPVAAEAPAPALPALPAHEVARLQRLRQLHAANLAALDGQRAELPAEAWLALQQALQQQVDALARQLDAAAAPATGAVPPPAADGAPPAAGVAPSAGAVTTTDRPALLLARLARAGGRLAEAVRLSAALSGRLAELVPAPGLLLDGERQLADELTRLLAEAEAAFARLADTGADLPAAQAAAALAALDAPLDAPAWAIAPAVLPVLQDACTRQQAAEQAAQLALRQGDVLLKWVEPMIEGARMAGAPFRALESALFATQSRLAALKSALQARKPAELGGLTALAQQSLTGLEDAVRAAAPQIEQVKPLVRQADLLIVQTARPPAEQPDDDPTYDYRVVLRCAERTADYGIPIIQDLRPIKRSDRDWLTTQLRDYRRAAYRQIGPRPGEAADGMPSARQLRRVGVFLRRMLIPDAIAAVLHRERWSFNITTNDLDLPWELLCFGDDAEDDGEAPTALTAPTAPTAPAGQPAAPDAAAPRSDVFCLGQAVSRLPLGEAFPRSTPSRPSASRRRRMLLVHADPAGTLSAAASEVQALADGLAPLLEIRRIAPAQATPAALNEALIDTTWDLIHFTGHAEFDATEPARSALLLQGGRFEAAKIARLARGRPLVFLNACASAASGAAPEAQAGQGLLGDTAQVAGLASAFLYSGALACLGTLWPVTDASAATLAVAFYRRVLAGDPLGEALRVARAACWQADPAGSTWAAYVLYGDPTLRLTEE